MEVTNREAFKLGFLLRCEEEKLNPQQIEARIKTAEESMSPRHFVGAVSDYVTGNPTAGIDPLIDFKKNFWRSGATVAGLAGLPLAAGWGAGHLAQKLKGDFGDPEDVKKQELINEYEKAKRQSGVSQSKALGL